MLGVLLVDKPEGITSHDVVQTVRRRLGTRRVGHAGTLDPIATGLLVLAVGPATRFLQYLPLEPKVYEGTFRFGQETNTYDSEGEVTREVPVPADLLARIEENLPGFRGPIEQLPPIYSAVKKEGRPLYAYARKGEEVEREPRNVFVEIFEILESKGADVQFRIVCSGGTYVRSLAFDLGQAVGCGAHVVELERAQVGKFSIEQAATLEDIAPDRLVALADALPPMPLVELNRGQLERVRTGQFVRLAHAPPEDLAALTDPMGRVVSVARVEGNLLHPECVLPAEALNGVL
ncbi:MAG: tRNA pseudouridine(55) synthase TruB [Fimbriimonadaceae bacterium]|nr:tRNA pseudouridine(55) synthase TruB [Fimbriimonadaceae bacterium]QYK56985.1 MAG: tRNA pseudouridine(55) synthase TruB [Fimbriimonadaceae bacterium]